MKMKISFICICILVISAFSYAIEIQVTFKQLPLVLKFVTFAVKNFRKMKFCEKTVYHFASSSFRYSFFLS